jgi:two-component system sensor histidine kinase YesM
LQLQSKILLPLIPLIILPILVLGWFAYSLLMEDARSRTRYQSATLLQQIELQTRTQLRTARANASLFSNTALIQQYIETPVTSKNRQLLEQQIMDLLYNYQLAYPEYYEIRILGSDGIEQVRSVLGNTANRSINESSSNYFIEANNNPDIIHTNFFYNHDNNKTALLASKPLYHPSKNSGIQKQLYGHLMLTISLDFLQPYINNADHKGEIFFTDNEGIILFHHLPELVGKQLSSSLFSTALNKAGGTSQFTGQYQGTETNFQAIKLHDRLLAFDVHQKNELTAKSSSLGWTVTLITSTAMQLATTLLFVILRKLLIRPIQKLTLAASEMGKGQVLVPIDIESSDEIGQLASTFRRTVKEC